MNDGNEQPELPEPTEVTASGHPPGEADMAKARKWFAHAKKAAETRNYDYAVELYVNGLALWPEALDEGLKPLRVVATARRMAGGKPAGFLAARKRPTSGKDAHKNLNNTLYLFGMDPGNLSLMEQILRLAAKAKCVAAARWMAPVLTEAYSSGRKVSEGRYAGTCAAMDEAADHAIATNEDEAALDVLRANIATAQVWLQHHPQSSTAPKAQSNASGKQTIVKGRFSKADGFEKSLKDAEAQHDLHDREKSAHSESRARELIERARKEWESNRGVPSKLLQLADLMIRNQDDATENEAINLLTKEHASGGDYVFKQKADDILMRQMNRHRRGLLAKLKADPQNPELRRALARHTANQTDAEIKIFEGRHQQYPSDMRIRFLLATRYFAASRHDDAIPVFQQAQADGRCRDESRLYIGRCFYEKKFYDQAVGTLRKTLGELPSTDSPLAMALNYWLARSLEASDNLEDAKKVYGNLIQLDYNYQDARQRLEKLVSAGEGD
ncbi:MAG: hypothetical protein ABII12_18610 [Planctomycetota bacterium]